MTPEDLREMLNYISDYSLYAYSEEVKEGYLTIEGGHRLSLIHIYAALSPHKRSPS